MADLHHVKFGWKPDVPDFRDFDYGQMRMKLEKPRTLPKFVDLSNSFGPCDDQGDLGSCTAHAISGAIEFDRVKQKLEFFDVSRLFIYYNEREAENTINEDAGAYIRTGIKSLANVGYCHESLWPYDISKFTNKPQQSAYDEAVKYKALSYYRIDNSKLLHLKACLAGGFPFVFGVSIYQSFYDGDANKGLVPMPGAHDENLGGHCILAVGYEDSKSVFKIRNSWGTGCGDNGYYYLPYDYLTNTQLADDFWTVRSITAV
jgi:C1A family cysteine protease